MPAPGDVYVHDRFYVDRLTGELKRKYLLVLAILPQGGDVVFRLLTSQGAARRREPRCDHGRPYPGFHLGVPGGPLALETWLDLRPVPEPYERSRWERDLADGALRARLAIQDDDLRLALECAASSDDISQREERAVRDVISRLR